VVDVDDVDDVTSSSALDVVEIKIKVFYFVYSTSSAEKDVTSVDIVVQIGSRRRTPPSKL
jgi:hypothetical protein